MIASPQPINDNAAPNTTLPSRFAPRPITRDQDFAHRLVLDMLNARLPLPAFAEQLGIPFEQLMSYIRTPEVQAELDAYDQLTALRARLLGQTARPVAIRRLLDILELPIPEPGDVDPIGNSRAFLRHAELVRRTATTIARESRAMDPRALERAPTSRHSRRVPPAPAEHAPPHDPNAQGDPAPRESEPSRGSDCTVPEGGTSASECVAPAPEGANDTRILEPFAPQDSDPAPSPADGSSASAPTPSPTDSASESGRPPSSSSPHSPSAGLSSQRPSAFNGSSPDSSPAPTFARAG